MHILADLLPYANFGNKENKAKRKAAESAMVENRLSNLYANEYKDNSKSDEINKLRKQELQESRKRRNSLSVDPLKKRSVLMRGEEKILAPYDSQSVGRLPKWNEKQNRGKYGNYTGVDTYLPKKGEDILLKREEALRQRNAVKPSQPVKQVKKPVNIVQKSVPFRRKPIEITKGAPQIVQPKILNLPKKEFDTAELKPKSGNMVRNLAVGAIGLGAIGAGLALANRRKKQKQNE